LLTKQVFGVVLGLPVSALKTHVSKWHNRLGTTKSHGKNSIRIAENQTGQENKLIKNLS
jgi:hypothetical protein